jgi:HEAT repeat protein
MSSYLILPDGQRPSPSPREMFQNLAESDLAGFTAFFRSLREEFPQEAVRCCLRYLATHELDHAARRMITWLTWVRYMPSLLDEEILSVSEAAHVAEILRQSDPQFFVGLCRLTDDPQSDWKQVSRALTLAGSLGDPNVLIPWMRGLTRHPNERIRSKAVKGMCEIRTNKALIERQLQSDDARVRANAIEAVWHSNNPDAEGLFRSALSDPHHRVVANALVGLYYKNDSTALEKMIELTKHPSPDFRAAMAWALGHIGDAKARPALEELTTDPVLRIRVRATRTLAALPVQRE